MVEQETIEPQVQVLDLNDFETTSEIVRPFMGHKVFTSLTTVKFTDLAEWYRLRYSGQKPDFVKPMYGTLLEFDSLEDFVSGLPSGRYPQKQAPDNDYSGFAVHEGNLIACNGNCLETFANGERHTFTHPLFNDIKFVDFSKDGESILISSSGTDCLLEFAYPAMELQWAWFAPEHGYSTSYDGKTRVVTQRMLEADPGIIGPVRVLDGGTDYSRLEIQTVSQATHINSARYLNKERTLIAATLFHPGHAIVIDRTKDTTQVVLKDLEHPHGFYEFGDGQKYYVVTSPTSGNIDILDGNYQSTHVIKGFIQRGENTRVWLQNTFPVSKNVLVLIDHYNHHIVFFNMFTKQKFVIPVHLEWKMFEFALQDKDAVTTKKVLP